VLFLVGLLFVGSSSASRSPSSGADYPGASWVAASPANFQRAGRPFSSPITRIVIHTTEGPYASAIRLFAHPGPVASAAYVIRSRDGAITQMVHESDVAWHSGNRQYNATSIGIEHEAFVHNCAWYTDAMYKSSAQLVAHLAVKYGIPIDRGHIIGHYQVPDPYHLGGFGGFAHHIDPGPCWNWPKYMGLVRADAGEIPVQRTGVQVVSDTTSANFRAPHWRRKIDANAEQQFGPVYFVARRSRTAPPASFRLTIPATGDYAVYGWWVADRNRNRAVPVGIDTVTGWQSLTVNERVRGGHWAYLGTFTLAAGKAWDVRVSRNSTSRGWIAVNAVAAEPVGHPLESRLLPGGFGYALTSSALALTSNAGSSWRVATPPGLAAADIRAAHIVDPDTGFVVGLSGTDGQGLGVWRTTDGGLTWISSPLPAPAAVDVASPISISAPDDLHWFVSLSLQQGLGRTGPGVLLASANGGRSWSRQVLPGSGPIAFRTATQGWLAPVDGGLFRTNDAGHTWRSAAIPAPTGFESSLRLAELPTFGDATDAVLPVTFRNGTRAAVSFLTSGNGGTTWQTSATVTGRQFATPAGRVSAAVADAANWLALPDGGSRVVGLVNGDPVRSAATAGLPLTAPGFELEQVSFASAATGWATASSCASGSGATCLREETLYRTRDGGSTWAPLKPAG
jgi:N-acetyl-anhydromuramyl-L-alanine amidase AmpD/photosystem II stability/assembly factor-like uncharacterized protein